VTAPLTHVLLTRFNLPSRGHESLVRARENWLRDRVGLFERYCLPSVLAQSSRSFTWLVYFDPQSPPWLLAWLREHGDRGHFVPLLREEVPRANLLADIRAACPHPRGDLLTTNLDNDDALAVDFVERVQRAPVAGRPTAVYLGTGLIVRGERLYRRTDRHNAFCSVRSAWTDPVTCWADWHNLLPRQMPAVVLGGEPGWLQVVHGANVSNRVRGRLTRPSAHRDRFPGVMGDRPDPRPAVVARDRLAAAPGRALRDGARSAVKLGIHRALGRDGIDRVKRLATGLRAQAARPFAARSRT
jgi:hypothetical protein